MAKNLGILVIILIIAFFAYFALNRDRAGEVGEFFTGYYDWPFREEIGVVVEERKELLKEEAEKEKEKLREEVEERGKGLWERVTGFLFDTERSEDTEKEKEED